MDSAIAASQEPNRKVIALQPAIEKENPGAAVDDEKSAFSYALKGSAAGVVVSPDALHDALLAAAARAYVADRSFLEMPAHGT